MVAVRAGCRARAAAAVAEPTVPSGGGAGAGSDGDDGAPGGLFEEETDEEETDAEAEEEDGTGELVYELAEWLPEQRAELSLLLEGAGIAYGWDGADLTVAEEHEAEVDGLFEQVHGASGRR